MAIPAPPSIPTAETNSALAALRGLLTATVNAVGIEAKWTTGEAVFQYQMAHLDFMRANIDLAIVVHETIEKCMRDDTVHLKRRQKCGLYQVKISTYPSWRAQKLAAEYIRAYGDDIPTPMEE